MRAVVQRVSSAQVTVDNSIIGQINQGFVVLLGIHQEATIADVQYLVKKITQLRVFEDADGKMNDSLAAIHGGILSISQFTLYAQTKKGNRPSFIAAARPEVAEPLYEAFNQALREQNISVATGMFGAHMQVSLVNDGPVTIIYDTRENETK